eukprot:CAMPEP_0181295744 /NCGR_PEP_ID=MMETSP1101-20121128/4313_1 /TAXON_ID=46948 /ORGANISM="Rhodomonas abbreviata, Strain Caron Lab Isolate" /LENGTH=386 /DNA_ID=CAMNT_0023400521 /DNA_START=99 /DNA_END=1259 /DNA_ORIENTATION=-
MSRQNTAKSEAQFIDVPGLTLNERLWLGANGGSAPKSFIKQTASTSRTDRWTPRHLVPAPLSKPSTAKSTVRQMESLEDIPLVNRPDTEQDSHPSRRLSEGFAQLFIDPEVENVQKKIQEQLKGRRHFRVQEGSDDGFMTKESFVKTLTRYGLALTDNERDILFEFYDKDGTGELDYEEFMSGIRGTEFVQTARSYGFETPDPGFHDEDPEGGFGHYVPPTDDLVEHTPRCAKAWQQQRALDQCPFGTDRRIFGGKWQYRTSSLIKAEAVVAPRYGKTSFPARKTLDDVIAVIADKLQERSKNTLAFTRMFNHFDTDKNGSIDRTEFEKLLDIYNIALTDDEISELFDHFGAEDGGIKYLPFVKTVEDFRRKHPLGGIAGVGRSLG